ncbi:coagulase domain-containing protein [Staphylococcus hyicus]|uniref:coagulase domain-containing protein n=1 Tax=Staphylococcus hyicus TaxID=1284 RepID=UPI00273984EB|nr:coagulase domain-containing protein [Staphylococcus hyicus]MDP4460741.1 coagulase domain-containing protein [Staphylococcus hyicus]
MKKKLLVLSASAILASNFILDNNASAVVKKSGYESESFKVEGKTNHNYTPQQFEDNLKELVNKLSLNEFEGYDQPEYEKAYQMYQDRFLGEIEAYYHFTRKEDSKKLGLTVERFNKIRESLIQNKNIFMSEVSDIESKNDELRRFTEDEFHKGLEKVYELEDKALMVRRAFRGNDYKDARIQLYNKLYLIVGSTYDERINKLPTNKRLLDEMCENLETTIDEFFKDVKLERPKSIERLTQENQEDEKAFSKVREDAKKATEDPQYRDSNVDLRAKKADERLAEMTKKSSEAKAKAEAERKAKAASMPLKSYKKDPKAFPHKQLRNELSIKFPESSPQLPIYTVATESQPQPVLKQQTKEEKVDVLKSKRPETTLNGLNGESNLVTMDESSNASTQFGSNGHVFEYSFDSTPKTTNVAKQNVKQENYNSVNNLAGMSGESQHVDFTQDSHPTTTYGGYGNAFDFTEDTAPKKPETITESHEIVLDYQTHATMSGFKTGVSTEAYYSSNELTK